MSDKVAVCRFCGARLADLGGRSCSSCGADLTMAGQSQSGSAAQTLAPEKAGAVAPTPDGPAPQTPPAGQMPAGASRKPIWLALGLIVLVAAIAGAGLLAFGISRASAPASSASPTRASSAGPTRPASPAISAGAFHTCALLPDGSVKCWGENDYGQLGDWTSGDNSPTPVSVSGISGALAVSAGFRHTCALLAGGSVKCWGRNDYGQLGAGTTTDRSTPVSVSGISDALAISAGGEHTCALLSGGSVKCWGDNEYGQLGDGTTTNSAIPVSVSGISDALAISAGGEHTCALLSGGSVKCWGDNEYGQLGDGTSGDNSPIPVAVSGLSGALAISAGGGYTCALLADSSVECWGDDEWGQLGDAITTINNGTKILSPTPVSVSGMSGAIAISAGTWHSCAVLADGSMKCWGYNYFGQLGDGTRYASSKPVLVSGIPVALAVSAGRFHTCALMSAGSVWCWGDDEFGQLGSGAIIDRYTPVQVVDLFAPATTATPAASANPAIPAKASAISAGGFHTCALLAFGNVKCWGRNDSGQLGNGSTTDSSIPVLVSGISDALAVSAGFLHTCARLAGGSVECWGNNEYGQLGDGITSQFSPSAIPVSVSGISDALAISAGGSHTCALLAGGSVECWGDNHYGQLGDGKMPHDSSTPVSVSGISGALAISAGYEHTCALLAGGSVKCWGDNDYGQLGAGSITDSSTPVSVSGISGALAISTGGLHTCALLSGGSVKCWGRNDSGQLGNGTTTGSLTPAGSVSNIVDAVAISAGGSHTCALLGDGSVRCWGDGSLTPAGSVSNIVDAVAISAGGSHTCALLSDGSVRCWGDGGATPVTVSGL